MDDFSAFTEGERALLEALHRHGVRFMLVGLSAAVLQGANTATRYIDLWFEDVSDARIDQAVREARGIWVPSAFGMRPPQIGGEPVGDRLDVVTHMHGLGTFAEELPRKRWQRRTRSRNRRSPSQTPKRPPSLPWPRRMT
jgi:hypothetical protein